MKWDMNVEGELIVAHSGKSRWREQRDIIHDKLLAMGTERSLPSSIPTAALSLSEKKPMEVLPHEKPQYDLLARFAKEDLKSGVFIETWLNAKTDPVVPEPKSVLDNQSSSITHQIKPEVKNNFFGGNLM